MAGWWRPILYILRLARLVPAVAAISNVWLIILLARHMERDSYHLTVLVDTPLVWLLLLGVLVAGGLHTYGVALNDVFDVRHDRMFRPQRPIAAGRVDRGVAVIVALVGLIVAVFASLFFGAASVMLCLLAALGILFYNAVAKFFPATGLITRGLVHAILMFIVNPVLGFAWPVWLTMTHVLATSGVVYRLEGRRPRLLGSELWAMFAGWAFWSLVLIGLMSWRAGHLTTDRPTIWIGPLVLAAGFSLITWRSLATYHPTVRRFRTGDNRYLQWSMLWLILYDVSWLIGVGLYRDTLGPLALLAVACAAMPLTHWLDRTPSRPGRPGRYHLPASSK